MEHGFKDQIDWHRVQVVEQHKFALELRGIISLYRSKNGMPTVNPIKQS